MLMEKRKTLDKKNIEDILALTPIQKEMFDFYLEAPGHDPYFEQLSLNITGFIDYYYFEQAWNHVIQDNQMLRTLVRWESADKPMQIILKEHKLKPAFHDLSHKRNIDKQKNLEKIKTGDRNKKFDFQDVPFRVTLCKLEPGLFEMIISGHHILYDCWSSGIIFKEFFTAYERSVNNKNPSSPPKKKFKEFIRWLKSRDTEKQEEFWKDYLKDFHPPGKKNTIHAGTSLCKAFQKENKRKLEDFAGVHKLSIPVLLYTAWGLLLQKINNSDDVVFGTVVHGRNADVQGIREMVGLFINTLPLRVRSFPGETMLHLLQRIDSHLQEREPYDSTPLSKIKQCSGLSSNQPLFDSMVIIDYEPLYFRLSRENKGGSLSLNSYSIVETTGFDLTLGITLNGGIEVTMTYGSMLFDRDTVNRLYSDFTDILNLITEQPGRKVWDLLLQEAEEDSRLYSSNRLSHRSPHYMSC